MEQKIEQYDTAPPNYSLREHCTNGLSHSPSCAQIGSYLIILFTVIVYLVCTISLKPSVILLILFFLFLTALVISSAIATVTDPTDRIIYYYKWSRYDKKVVFAPEYDKVLYCQFCDSYCMANSKHCRACNRCVSQFDHHCMWFNNCVGYRNYRSFMVSIISTFGFAVVVILHVVLSSFQVDFSNGTQVAKIIISWIAGLLMSVFGFLLFNLIALHIYLIASGMTTYQFLQQRKKEEELQRKKKEEIDKNSMTVSQKIPNNKVMPASEAIQLEPLDSRKVAIGRGEDTEQIKTEQQKSHAKLNIHMELQKQNRNTIFNQSQTFSSKSRVESNEQKAESKLYRQPEMGQQHLPRFLRQNRSLKFLLPKNQAQSPLKRRQQQSESGQHSNND